MEGLECARCTFRCWGYSCGALQSPCPQGANILLGEMDNVEYDGLVNAIHKIETRVMRQQNRGYYFSGVARKYLSEEVIF